MITHKLREILRILLHMHGESPGTSGRHRPYFILTWFAQNNIIRAKWLKTKRR